MVFGLILFFFFAFINFALALNRGGSVWGEVKFINFGCEGKFTPECSDSLIELAESLIPQVAYVYGFITPYESKSIGHDPPYCHPESTEYRITVHGHTNDRCITYAPTKMQLPGCTAYVYSAASKGWLSRGKLIVDSYPLQKLGNYHCVAGSYYYAGNAFIDTLYYYTTHSDNDVLHLQWRDPGISEFVFKRNLELPSVYVRHFEACLDPHDDRLTGNITRIGNVFLRTNFCGKYVAYNGSHSICDDYFTRPVCSNLLFRMHRRGLQKLIVPRITPVVSDALPGSICNNFNVTDAELVKVVRSLLDHFSNDNSTYELINTIKEAASVFSSSSDPIVGATVYQHIVNVTDLVVASSVVKLGTILGNSSRNVLIELQSVSRALNKLASGFDITFLSVLVNKTLNRTFQFVNQTHTLRRKESLQDISFWNSTLYDFYDKVYNSFRPPQNGPEKVSGVFDWLASALGALMQPFVSLFKIMIKELVSEAMEAITFIAGPVLELVLYSVERLADYVTMFVESLEKPLIAATDSVCHLLIILTDFFIKLIKLLDSKIRLVEYLVLMFVSLRCLVNNTFAVLILLAIIATFYPIDRPDGESSVLELVSYIIK